MREHKELAYKIWRQHGYDLKRIELNSEGGISGFFMVLNKQAWLDVGGFPAKGFFGEDTAIARKMWNAGKPMYVMRGLYCWHRGSLKGARQSSWVDGGQTSKDFFPSQKRKTKR